MYVIFKWDVTFIFDSWSQTFWECEKYGCEINVLGARKKKWKHGRMWASFLLFDHELLFEVWSGGEGCALFFASGLSTHVLLPSLLSSPGIRWKWQQQTGMRGARGWYPWRGWSGPNRRGDNKNDGNRWRMDTCQMSIIGLGAEDRIGMSSFLFCIFFLDERWVASWVRVAWHEVARKEKGTYRVSGRYSGL